jgi:lysozyme family protein
MSAFEKALQHLFGVEGKYADHKSDRGGKTMLGVTEALARKYGWTRPMSELTPEFAADVYLKEFWNPLRLTDIASVSFAVALELFDTAVNMGPGRAGKFLQRALNCFNQRSKDFPDLIVDGQVGTATVSALIAFLKRRGRPGEVVMLRALNSQQGDKYLDITEADETQEDFVFGWFLTRVAGEFA